MEKAIIITGTKIEILNDYLNDGWVVKTTCPMPSSCGGGSTGYHIQPQCLVIITNNILK